MLSAINRTELSVLFCPRVNCVDEIDVVLSLKQDPEIAVALCSKFLIYFVHE